MNQWTGKASDDGTSQMDTLQQLMQWLKITDSATENGNWQLHHEHGVKLLMSTQIR